MDINGCDDKRFIQIRADDIEKSDGNDIYATRKALTKVRDGDAEVTIGIVAYNRLDVTKKCVESVLKYTDSVDFKLIMVYNENEQGEGILDYFNSVDFENKLVVHITENIGAGFAYRQIAKFVEGKYFVLLPNDVIVTHNWISNLIKCAESDIKIGMVTPVSSNVSNHQQVNLGFSDYDDMQRKAEKYNVSDPKKWHERLRLITLAALFKTECLAAIGDVMDIGFVHNFADDDVSFRVRRAGYKCILARDTWVCHEHSFASRNNEALVKAINIGRKIFSDKYYGVDAWSDTDNFIFDIVEKLNEADSEKPSVLGVDVKCGTPVLEIKNKLREFGRFETECFAFTQDAKYFTDLQTVCGADNVICSDTVNISEKLNQHGGKVNLFDYIIVGREINMYSEPYKLVRSLCRLLKPKGQLFVYLKNTYNIFNFLRIIGYYNLIDVRGTEHTLDIMIEDFIRDVSGMGADIEYLGKSSPILSIPAEYIDVAKNKIRSVSPTDADTAFSRLIIDKYGFRITAGNVNP